jgi:hypothetical protein
METRGRASTVLRSGIAAAGVALVALLLAISSVTAAAGWSPRVVVDSFTHCNSSVSLAIDASGRSHVAAICDDSIRYSELTANGWVNTPLPTGGFDEDAQLTLDGSTLYLAYSHEPFQGCGDSTMQAGVYIRKRTLPGGAWTTPKRVGLVMDQLVSFRVANGVFHATIFSSSAEPIYETDASGKIKRYALPGGVGASSLRVGSDGRARIVYEATSSLRYAEFVNGALRWSNIPSTSNRDAFPVLVLDADNAAHIVYEHDNRSGRFGCVDEEQPTSRTGTYYTTNFGGQWTPLAERRLTATVGSATLTFDTAKFEPHVLVGNESGLKYYTTLPGGSWTGVTISNLPGWSSAIRFDQTRHRLVVALADGRVYGLSKP